MNDRFGSMGLDILDAIKDLNQLVQKQSTQISQLSRHHSHSDHSPAPVSSSPIYSARTGWLECLSSSTPPSHTVIGAQGCETILEWDILAPYRTSNCLFTATDDEHEAEFDGLPLPALSLDEMLRLGDRYIQGVHKMNPFLDLRELHKSMSFMAGNGFDWSTRTCLVALVCAIGAVTSTASGSPSSPEEKTHWPASPDLPLAMKYWSVATKRLGLAISRNDVEAVQCLCLAGIWHMNLLQPLQAARLFHLAGASWHGLKLMNKHLDSTFSQKKSLTGMQALYFAIWKSECELLMELPLPSTDLDDTLFPHGFPTPPTFDPGARKENEEGGSDDERTWWYYLAEIAARHLLNRISCTVRDFPDALTAHHIQKMLKRADMMETQIHNWYLSLPGLFRFDIPTGLDLGPCSDDLTSILRHRYLGLREYVGRPFVRLCVDYPLDDLEPSLRSRVTALASQSLHYCMIKILQLRDLRHQGTWFQMRQVITCSLILSSVCFAQQMPWRSGAHALSLPEDWLIRVRQTLQRVETSWWREESGGLKAMYALVQSVLGACSDIYAQNTT